MPSDSQGQMSRDELLAARKRVEAQIETLQFTTSRFDGIGPSAKQPLLDELQTILDEIDAELAETATNDSANP